MKTFWIGLMVTAVALPGLAQKVDVKVNPQIKVDPKVQVKVDPKVRVNVNPHIELDEHLMVDVGEIAHEAMVNVMNELDHDLDIDFDFDHDLDFDTDAELYEYQENTQEVEIPLSKPGERGTLDVESHNGRIKVTGYDGPTVKVKMIKYEKRAESKASGGMRMVSSGGFNFEASEYNNVVKVENDGWNDRVDFEIQVPKNFNIKAETYNNGHIVIDGLNGELNVESYNGPITLTNISGSASASTYNGAIEVTFAKVTADVNMAFSTYNGNVDISVPDGTKFTSKMKTNREIYTDFESFTIKQSKPVTNKGNNGRFNVKYENWVEGDLNGGGAEVLMKTTNGNIYIRKK